MKVLFLDFDGVILTLRTALAHGKGGWSAAKPDPVLVQAITRVCETGVKIVVSSTWRDMGVPCIEKLGSLKRFLHKDWRTPELSAPPYKARPYEIREWLREHPEVKDYRILDDDGWHWFAYQKKRELKCCSENGASARTIMDLLTWAGLRERKRKMKGEG